MIGCLCRASPVIVIGNSAAPVLIVVLAHSFQNPSSKFEMPAAFSVPAPQSTTWHSSRSRLRVGKRSRSVEHSRQGRPQTYLKWTRIRATGRTAEPSRVRLKEDFPDQTRQRITCQIVQLTSFYLPVETERGSLSGKTISKLAKPTKMPALHIVVAQVTISHSAS